MNLADFQSRPFVPAPPAPFAPDLTDSQKMALLMLRRRMGNELAGKVLDHCEEMSFPEPEPGDWASLIREGYICRQKMPKGTRTWLVLTPRGLAVQASIAADLARKFKIHHITIQRTRGFGASARCCCGHWSATAPDRDYGESRLAREGANHVAELTADPDAIEKRRARMDVIFARVAAAGEEARARFEGART